MNVTKQNETYTISDTLENGWVITGTVVRESDANMTVNVNINNDAGNVGSFGYGSNNYTNVNITAVPKYFEAVYTYIGESIKDINSYFTSYNSTTDVEADSETATADNN